jgi:uncharacterized membrane protein YraQ (UPF0718 family)
VENDIVILKVKDFISVFLSIVWEAFPFIVLGSVIAGFLEEFVPQRLISRILPRNRLVSIPIGALLGLVFPMCECGIIPVMRRLLRKGLPLSCCVAYLLAGPVINVVVLLSTYAAFSGANIPVGSARLVPQMPGWMMVSMRAGLAFLVAIGTALIVERRYRRYGNSLLMPLAMPPSSDKLKPEAAGEVEEERPGLLRRMGNVSETALHDFTDILVFLIIGALLSASVRMWLTQDMIAEWSSSWPLLPILIMMGLAILLCLCSEADAFVAASYLTLQPAAKLAFLVLGPMMDIKLYVLYTRVFRPRLIWTIFPAVAVQVFLYCSLVYFVWKVYGERLASSMGP